jgi:hypothetical protein
MAEPLSFVIICFQTLGFNPELSTRQNLAQTLPSEPSRDLPVHSRARARTCHEIHRLAWTQPKRATRPDLR